MAKVEASRFAILKIEDDYDSDEKRSGTGSGTKGGSAKGGGAGGKQGAKQGAAGGSSQAAKKKNQAKKKASEHQEVGIKSYIIAQLLYITILLFL